MDRIRDAFEKLRLELEGRFSAFVQTVESKVDRHHSENRVRLQAIDTQSIENGVKLDRLYGSDGQPGAVDRLTEKVNGLGDKIMYGCGIIAATVVLVGWFIEMHK